MTAQQKAIEETIRYYDAAGNFNGITWLGPCALVHGPNFGQHMGGVIDPSGEWFPVGDYEDEHGYTSIEEAAKEMIDRWGCVENA